MGDPLRLDPARAYAVFLTAGNDWADKDAAASLLEETRKSLLAQLKLESDAKSESGRETEALAQPLYRDHIASMIEARQAANRAKVRYEAVRILVELRRTEETSRRMEMGLVRQGAMG